MSSDLAIKLTPGEAAQLDALAQSQALSSAELALEAVRAFLRFDTSFREAVVEGLAAVAEGDLAPFDQVEGDLRAYMRTKADPDRS